MKKLSRSEVLAEALNCGAFQNDGSHQIPAGLLVTFEADELMVFVETIIRESLGSREGFATVPIEPTAAMHKACDEAARTRRDVWQCMVTAALVAPGNPTL